MVPKANLSGCVELINQWSKAHPLPELDDETCTVDSVMKLYLHSISIEWSYTAEFASLRNANTERCESTFAQIAK